MLGKLCLLQELGLEKQCVLQKLSEQAWLNQEEKSLPSAMSLWRPLLTKFNIVPAGKGKTFEGPNSIFTEQSMED